MLMMGMLERAEDGSMSIFAAVCGKALADAKSQCHGAIYA